MQGRQSLLTFFTTITRWSRSTSNFYALVGQNLTREFGGKFMRRLQTCLMIAEADRVLCHLLMFLTVFFYLIYKMKYSCYQECSVIHGWFVYCGFGWEMHRFSKSLEIRFRVASFSKMSLLTCPCLKSLKRFWPHFMTFRSSISTGKPEQLLSLMFFFFFGFLKSSVVYAA